MEKSKYENYFERSDTGLWKCNVDGCNLRKGGAIYNFQQKSNGGTSSLRAHLAHHKDEYEEFLNRESEAAVAKKSQPARKRARPTKQGWCLVLRYGIL